MTWRHRRVILKKNALDQLVSLQSLNQLEQSYLENWILSERPFVGRAWRADEKALRNHFAPLGLMYFGPDGYKLRLAFYIPRDLILRVDEPALLSEAQPFIPNHLQSLCEQVLVIAKRHQIAVQVYGSAFWSLAQKKVLMSPESDIDLLFKLGKLAQAQLLIADLMKLDRLLFSKLDGEIELDHGQSVAWKEWLSASDYLLLKSDFEPLLISKTDLWRAH
ncbi:MAG: malonate decarboxylase holo-[acyl-carrier-protein] synthase [Polynucleobacter sp.]|jgi:malonate decarboxylase holo-[acyl-carrier-protein] synthase|nr:malonate decarboxylase holo-[acyl-carrier-protein] synthase [Polynucleobacter sp.]